ncbi:uncharacterized protein KY384_004898 [Bacidia gigantensis]|uniref:uncharacterized protein n=1 Tax=Bacidia gigantensis TaxID=2732470 RepID=UPI001D0398F7|nr:uncharacterized protein KY384_004898 [Bacidia gigantensis]KAG8530396.1 hypothetical protein KY384_004898 [Bacidia gigantensis]
MASKRMTANPVKPARYRPGKPVAEDASSEEDDDDLEGEQQPQRPILSAPPKATSFRPETSKVAANIRKIEINEKAAAEEIAKAAADDDFVTEESEEEEGSKDRSESELDSISEQTSSEDEAPKKLVRPTFIKKGQRKEANLVECKNEDNQWAEEEARRKEKADAMIQEQLEKDVAARAAGKKDWDDDELEEIDPVDDADGLDPETERAAWKLRELKRVKREREVIEEAEKQREEVERRRNLSKDERDAEDREFLESQRDARDGKGTMSFMQKYYHKGAFFQNDAVAEELANRDIMGSRYADDVANRDVLPQYMQIRDMTQLGRKSRTKYKDLKSEDTGKWGQDGSRGHKKGDVEERFMPGGGRGRSGANAAPLGDRRKAPEDAPRGPKDRGEGISRDSYRPQDDYRRGSPDAEEQRKRPDSRSRSYSRRRKRRQSYSSSRSRSPRRGHEAGLRSRRKRNPSSSRDRFDDDKRQRIDAH